MAEKKAAAETDSMDVSDGTTVTTTSKVLLFPCHRHEGACYVVPNSDYKRIHDAKDPLLL